MEAIRWMAVVGGGIVAVVIAGWAGLRWLQRPMFQPGSAAQRVQDLGQSLVPPPGQRADAAAWTVSPGVTLHHFAVGEGEDIVVVHGGPGSPPEMPWQASLVSGGRWHFYHQRGCGRSTRPFDRLEDGSLFQQMQTVEAELGLAQQIADLERIRHILGRRRLTLVAHSFGALPAALYAAEFPDNVEALVLVSPAPLFVMPVAGGDVFTQVRERLPVADRERYDAYIREYFDFRAQMRSSDEALAAFYGRFGEFYAAASGHAPRPATAGAVGGWLTMASYLSLGRRHDWRDALQQMQAPVLVIHGADDLQPATQSRAVAAAIPGAAFVEIERAGHFPFDEAPEAFAQQVGRFLGSRTKRTGGTR